MADNNEIKAINKTGFAQRLREYKRKPLSLVLFILVVLAAAISVLALVFLIVYILVMGVPHITPELFAWEYNSDNVSCMPAIINTVVVTLLAKRGNKFVKLIRTMAETLSGIPSIVYGLFGMLFFVTTLQWRLSLLAGSFTLAIMVLPTIMRTTEEALLSVPDSYREGSYGLGAGKLRTIIKIILPSAMPGILAGIILAVGRIVGETAALLYTSGSASGLAKGLMSSGRTLAIHMYVLANEGLHTDQAWATAVVLLVLVLLINTLSAFIAKKLTSKNK